MKTLCVVTGAVLLAVGVSAGADELERSSSRDVTAKPAVKETLAVEKYSPTQVLCLKQRRTGSRVITKRCQTLAAWKQEMD